MGNTTISPGTPGSTGNARTDVPDAPEEGDSKGASGFSRLLSFPGTQSLMGVGGVQ